MKVSVVTMLRGMALSGVLGLTFGCAIGEYPGQPGMKSDGFAKIDMESLDEEGLWVYDVKYDNTKDGAGVSAIVTKLYPGAQTYTTNVRTNAHGTLYKHKGELAGAVIQAIVLPQAEEVIIPERSSVGLLIGYTKSMDEVDSRNLADENIFKKEENALADLSPAGIGLKKFKWSLLRAGSFTSFGSLSYEVQSIKLGEKEYAFDKPVTVSTNLTSTAIQTSLNGETRRKMAAFVEEHFPKGYKGLVQIKIVGRDETFDLDLTIQTPGTLRANGTKVSNGLKQESARSLIARLK